MSIVYLSHWRIALLVLVCVLGIALCRLAVYGGI